MSDISPNPTVLFSYEEKEVSGNCVGGCCFDWCAQALTVINLLVWGILLVFFSSLSSSGLLCMWVEKWRHKTTDPVFDQMHVNASIPGEVLSVKGAWAWGYSIPKLRPPVRFPLRWGPEQLSVTVVT